MQVQASPSKEATVANRVMYVIGSCNTPEQIEGAEAYMQSFLRMYGGKYQDILQDVLTLNKQRLGMDLYLSW